jgi:MinD-like ATPase involved in chromosome partitioning or flagellar assembly
VGVIDTDIQSPGIHAIFGYQEHDLKASLNDFLFRKETDVRRIAYAVADVAERDAQRAYLRDLPVWLIPASLRMDEIARVLRDGYDVQRLIEGFELLASELQLDFLVIDTHPGLNEETLLSIAISQSLLVLLRPDEQDYQGTAVTLDIARRLDVPRLYLTVNKVISRYDPNQLRADIEATYQAPVLGVLPLSEDVAFNASTHVFALRHPEHPWSHTVARIADILAEP